MTVRDRDELRPEGLLRGSHGRVRIPDPRLVVQGREVARLDGIPLAQRVHRLGPGPCLDGRVRRERAKGTEDKQLAFEAARRCGRRLLQLLGPDAELGIQRHGERRVRVEPTEERAAFGAAHLRVVAIVRAAECKPGLGVGERRVRSNVGKEHRATRHLRAALHNHPGLLAKLGVLGKRRTRIGVTEKVAFCALARGFERAERANKHELA